MKKFLIGCGIVALVTFLFCGSCTLYVGYKVYDLTAGVMEAADELNQLEDDFPFTPPAEGTPLDPDRFGDYREARREIGERVSGVPLVRALAQSVDAGDNSARPAMSPLDGIKALFQIPSIVSDIAVILRKYEMTPSEYAWNARVVFAAMHDGWEQKDQAMEGVWTSVLDRAASLQVKIDDQLRQSGQQYDVDLMSELDRAAAGGESIDRATYQVVKRHIDELAPNATVVVMDLFAVAVLQELQMRGPSRGLPSETQPTPVELEPEPESEPAMVE